MVGFYGISTLVGYLMPNPVYTYIKVGWVRFYGLSTLVGYLMLNPVYTYIKYIGFASNLKVTFLNEPKEYFFAYS